MYDFCRFALQPYQRRACGARVVGDELHGIHPVFQRGEVDVVATAAGQHLLAGQETECPGWAKLYCGTLVTLLNGL